MHRLLSNEVSRLKKRFLFESAFVILKKKNQYSFFSHFALGPRICGDRMSSFNSLKGFLFEKHRKKQHQFFVEQIELRVKFCKDDCANIEMYCCHAT